MQVIVHVGAQLVMAVGKSASVMRRVHRVEWEAYRAPAGPGGLCARRWVPRPDEVAGQGVELEEVAVLARLQQYLRVHARDGRVGEALPPGAVIVPDIVRRCLECPIPRRPSSCSVRSPRQTRGLVLGCTDLRTGLCCWCRGRPCPRSGRSRLPRRRPMRSPWSPWSPRRRWRGTAAVWSDWPQSL